MSTGSSRAENLKIGYGAFSLGYALIWITKEGRLFEKNGLDVDVLYLESNLVRTALISGDIPIGAMSGAAMAAPKLQGADLVVLLGFPKGVEHPLWSRAGFIPRSRNARLICRRK
jgi:ABC-type nitrate/sulfonate/bicarbonate transport system substrate-binding protein